ncbi:CTD small phosphatase-like protein [Rhynchospora pubera]|uniref:Mitochondrial import inner membrane translocase subunit TIM50 n=1 Tax=Rhynchospora pubera TaxID=906938 RepID=A0AAV8E4L5_9POAL|nr:CTD small phosphatase-like protein [Rhynchospora pubera]
MLDASVIIDHNPDVNVKPWCNAVKLSPFTRDVNDVELWSLLSFFEAQGNFMDLRNLLHVCSCAPPMPGLPLPTRKTLFLDLDETLISHVSGKPPDRYDFATKNFYITKQAGIDRLLQVATDYGYEIVIFTAGSRGYASPIIDRLDPKGLIAHRLYWDSCIKSKEGRPVKDLALTGRSLDKCVIIDDRWLRVRQRDNVIMARPFTGDLQDSELTRLLCFFKIEREYKYLREAVSRVNYQLGYLNL